MLFNLSWWCSTRSWCWSDAVDALGLAETNMEKLSVSACAKVEIFAEGHPINQRNCHPWRNYITAIFQGRPCWEADSFDKKLCVSLKHAFRLFFMYVIAKVFSFLHFILHVSFVIQLNFGSVLTKIFVLLLFVSIGFVSISIFLWIYFYFNIP